jgi:signal transduction histidine kinase
MLPLFKINLKKSFKVYVFVHVFFAAACIIFINRLVSQYFLQDQLTQQIQANLVKDIVACGHLMDNKEAFLICNSSNGEHNVSRLVNKEYILCVANPSAPSLAIGVCQKLTGIELPVQTDVPHGRLGIVGQDNEQWYVARKNDDTQAYALMLPTSAASDLRYEIWALRDRNLIFTLPFILLSLGLLTFYITRLLFKPVQSIKNTLNVLEPQHLDRATELNSPFYEFDDFLKIFDELRQRLQKSFTKARRFAADASHELRTPLTILRGHAEEMITELPTGSDSQIRMRVIADQVDHLIDISSKLLLLSQADANSIKLQLETLDLSQLVWNWAQDARSFDERIEIKHSIEPRLSCRGDRLLLLQVMQNLYTNAINYNIVDGWLRITLKQQAGEILLCFENPSEMIPADFSSRAFDRFYRGPDSLARGIKGYGLGLSLCQEIAKVHGGSITIETTHDRVWITLILPTTI